MEITEGGVLPLGYGIAWRNYNRMTFTAFVIPFNHTARWCRDLWYWLAKPRGYREQIAYHSGYDKGFVAGETRGELRGRKGLQEELLANIEAFRRSNTPPSNI